MPITLFGIFITISLRAFAWSPADTWFPSSAELDALNTYLDENIEGIDSSTSYYARDFFQGGVWTYYYPHRIEKEAGVAWQVYCLLNGRWHCDKRENRVLTFKKPDYYLTSEKTDYYVRLDDELEAEVAKQILSFVREYASSIGKEILPHHLTGIAFIKQTEAVRYEITRDTGGRAGKHIIEIERKCELETCSYRVIGNRWRN